MADPAISQEQFGGPVGMIEALLIKGETEGFNILEEEKEDKIEVRITMSFSNWIKQLNYLPEDCDVRKRIIQAILCATKGLRGIY